MDREETKRALAACGVVPSRAMGQNFLVDDEVSRWIAESIGCEDGGCVIEVGSGLGALTGHLAGRADRLVVIEKDGRTLGIDLVGCPGEFGAALDLERYRILRRAGMPLFPLPYRSWLEDQAGCLTELNEYHGAARV